MARHRGNGSRQRGSASRRGGSLSRSRWNFWFASAIALFGVGCGGSEVPGENAARAERVEEVDEDEWEENTVPVISWIRLEPESPAPGGSITAQVNVSDADGDDLELGFAWRINGRPVRASGKTITLGSALKGDPISLTVTASDGWDESESYTVTTVVGNTPPVVQAVSFDPLGTIHRGQRVTARPVAIDLDGDPLEYEYRWWVNDREISDRGEVLDTSRLKRGDEVRIDVVATDGYSRSKELRSAPIRVENSPPRFVSSPGNTGDETVYRYQAEAEDPDGDRRLRFRLETAPSGMTIDPISGSLSWAPPASATGSHPVEVVVDDLQGGIASQRFTVEIGEAEPVAPPANAAPVDSSDDR